MKEWITTSLDWLAKQAPDFGAQLEQAALLLLIAAILVVIMLYAIRIVRFLWGRCKRMVSNYQRMRRDRKVRKEQEARERSIIADAVGKALEELEFSGELQHDRKNFWYNRLGNVLSIPDLLPRGRRTLKQRIMERRGTVTPVVIPGEGPVQDIKPNTFEKRKKFSLFKAKAS